MSVLKEGDSGPQVAKIQQLLKDAGFSPGAIDGDFGPATKAAVLGFQKSHGLLADGIVGPKTLAVLDPKAEPAADSHDTVIDKVTVTMVSKMFSMTPVDNIKENLPFVFAGLKGEKLTDKNMILMALATIRAETESFEPISEFKSKFNTSPGGHPFDLYDNRKDLGNQGKPDGASFRGRGYIQLTGRANYKQHGNAIGLGDQLVQHPEKANDPTIAGKLLAHFLKNKEKKIREALLDHDLKAARKLVNGGSHGLDRFSSAFHIGEKVIPG